MRIVPPVLVRSPNKFNVAILELLNIEILFHKLLVVKFVRKLDPVAFKLLVVILVVTNELDEILFDTTIVEVEILVDVTLFRIELFNILRLLIVEFEITLRLVIVELVRIEFEFVKFVLMRLFDDKLVLVRLELIKLELVIFVLVIFVLFSICGIYKLFVICALVVVIEVIEA